MTAPKCIIAATLLGAAVGYGTIVQAQAAAATEEAADLPEQCQTLTTHHAMPGMPDMKMKDMPQMGEANMALMDAMMKTQPGMMQGMTAENPDVAFVCGMIMHHKGAIGMAEAEIQHGGDETIKEAARKIIADQTQEIEQFTAWLAEHAN